MRENRAMFLGKRVESKGRKIGGRRVYMREDDRQTHMHIIGASGTGKSKFLEHMIRSDIEAGKGLCLIDPHGYLYEDLLCWIEERRYLYHPDYKNKIILFDPSSDTWTFGFNPLNFNNLNSDLAFCVDSMVKACSQVWGGEDTNRTPLLKRCLRATFHALAEKNHTLLESLDVINTSRSSALRPFLTENLQDYVFKEVWDSFNLMSPRERQEHFMSINNRMLEFLASERIRHIIGQKENIIDFQKMMDDGCIVLINLSSGSKLSDDNSRLLGTLIVNDLFLRARNRKPNSAPFYLYIDECALYINETIGRILDEGRKFGLHLILAHQHLAQLRKAGEKVYSSVMTNARTKVVFGGLSPEDARTMVDSIFLGELDLEEGKGAFYRPVVVESATRYFESISHGRSLGENWSKSQGETQATGTTKTHTLSDSYSLIYAPETETSGESIRMKDGVMDPNQEFGTYSESQTKTTKPGSSEQTAKSHAESSQESASSSQSATEGGSAVESEQVSIQEGLVPIYKWMPTQGYSLEEQVYRSMAEMVNQRTQYAICKIPGVPSIFLRTPNVKEDVPTSNEELEVFKLEAYEQTNFARSIEEVKVELLERRKELEEKAVKHQGEKLKEETFFRE
jgi:Type IV secretion-system coupling protein DNA-binding domain